MLKEVNYFFSRGSLNLDEYENYIKKETYKSVYDDDITLLRPLELEYT